MTLNGEFGEATAGGDLTVYVDRALRRVVAGWLGEGPAAENREGQ